LQKTRSLFYKDFPKLFMVYTDVYRPIKHINIPLSKKGGEWTHLSNLSGHH
jgi:hypothetical protein